MGHTLAAATPRNAGHAHVPLVAAARWRARIRRPCGRDFRPLRNTATSELQVVCTSRDDRYDLPYASAGLPRPPA